MLMAVHVHMQGPEYVELSVIDSNKNVKKQMSDYTCIILYT